MSRTKDSQPATADLLEHAVVMIEMFEAVFAACNEIAFRDGERRALDRAWPGLMHVARELADDLNAASTEMVNQARAKQGLTPLKAVAR